MPFASAAYCFPASLPPRPKTGGSSGWNSSSNSTASPSSNSTVKNDKIYSHRNGPVHNVSNNINVRDFNQDKRKRGSKSAYFDKGKETAGVSVPTPTTGSPMLATSIDLHNNYKSKRKSILSTSSNHNHSCSNNRGRDNVLTKSRRSLQLQQQQQQQQQKIDQSSYKNYSDNIDCGVGDDGGDFETKSQEEEERSERERNRMIREMLYGREGREDTGSHLKFGEFDKANHCLIEPTFGFVYGIHGSSSANSNNKNSSSSSSNKRSGNQLLGEKGKHTNRFSSFLGRRVGGVEKEERKSLGWLWQKRSLSEGNLYTVRRIDEDDDEYGAGVVEEISYHREGNVNQQQPPLVRREIDRAGKEMEIVKMIGMDHGKNRMERGEGEGDKLIAKTWQRNPISVNMDMDTRRNDVNAGVAMRQKSLPQPKFFRSLSLRNLLPIGGKNNSRTAPGQGKPVQPPTVPGLISFSSFRVKKSHQHSPAPEQQPSPSSSSSESQEDSSSLQHHHHLGPNNCNKETQRFSGSSLGSAGSSYASSASTSSGDNRSSIGTDDGFLPPPCIHSDVHLKDLTDDGVLYHPASQQIHLLKSSSSVDSFSTASTSSLQHHPPPHPLQSPPAIDMHQGFYGKVGGISNSSSGCGNTNSTVVNCNNVHVDSHASSVQQQQQQQQQQQHQHHQAQKTIAGSSTPSPLNGTVGGCLNNPTNSSVPVGNTTSGGNSAHHHHHHQIHHHPILHHHHLQQQQNNVAGCSPTGSVLPMATNHYQTQISLEDQGIDMTQSPGRESPSSTASSNTGSGSGSAIGSVGSGSGSGSNGCRHSTASFDSGRASSSIYQQGVRYSTSESSSGSFRHSYHSSSSSLGSIAPEEICNFDVGGMLAQGVPDHEILNAWLTGIHFECYYQSFIQAGYDMHTISRMTPEDLNAMGVTKPHDRKRLKSEISQLNISDGLPSILPNSIEEWLCLLKLEEYASKLRAQGYHSVRQLTNITWEDLEDTGVLKLGHQKKFMLAIKRIEDILAGKRIPASNTPNAYLTPMDSFPRGMNRAVPNTTNHSGQSMTSSYGNHNGVQNHSQFHPVYNNSRGLGITTQQQMWRQGSQNSTGIYGHTTLTHQPQLHHVNSSSTSAAPQPSPVTPQYHPDVISIQVNRRKSIENVSNREQEPIYSTSSFLPSQKNSGQMSLNNLRSGNSVRFEEGEITPTNECATTATATLPRLLKNKPISKIMGGGCLNSNVNGMPPELTPTSCVSLGLQQPVMMQQYGDGYKSLPSKGKMEHIGRMSKAGLNLYSGPSSGNYSGATNFNKTNGLKGGPPPPPPPRTCSDETKGQGTEGDYRFCGPAPRRGSCSAVESTNNNNVYSSGQQHPVLSSFSASNIGSRGIVQPPPPPNLSCDKFNCSPPSNNYAMSEFPPPPPDMVSHGGLSTTAMGLRQTAGGTTNFTPSSSSSSSSSSSTVNTNASPNTLKMNSANASVQYYNNSSSCNSANHNSNTVRNSPPNVSSANKSRDPSPVGSDYSIPDDSDLPPSVLLSRGVRRNGSDASFKSNSSTESESIPFANDNAGTIKNKPGSRTQLVSTATVSQTAGESSNQGAGDVLNDIGNMLADLTDELDAILEQEMSSKS